MYGETIESYEIKYCAKEKSMNMDAMNKTGETWGSKLVKNSRPL